MLYHHLIYNDVLGPFPVVYYVGIRLSNSIKSFCERGFDSSTLHPHIKDIVDVLVAANCPAGRYLRALTHHTTPHPPVLFVGTADVPESIESATFDSDRNNFQELGPLNVATMSRENRYRVDAIPASDRRSSFLLERRLDQTSCVFVLYIYEAVAILLFPLHCCIALQCI